MDIIPQAIPKMPKENARRIQANNTHYETGTAEDLLLNGFAAGFRPDSIVVDPPRTGLDDHLLQALVAQPQRKWFYISCNVSTLARDLVKLASSVFKIEYLQSVDMFSSNCSL